MFDSIGAFTKQFTPTTGGYLFYPSNASGGKLVTDAEYALLIKGWRRVAGGRGIATFVGIIVLAQLVRTIVSHYSSMPDWSDAIIVIAPVIGILASIYRASLAPNWLVADRSAITAPRPIAEAKREARALTDWPLNIFALLFSSIAFLILINSPERDLRVLAWLFGTSALFGLWAVLQKLRDR